MPHTSPLPRQWSLIVLLLVLLRCGFLATSLASYYTALDSIRAGIINTELPLTSDNVYSEIQKDLVETTLECPDKKIKGKKNRMIYQKIVSRKLLRVVTEGDTLITVYMTDKIKKYMEEGD